MKLMEISSLYKPFVFGETLKLLQSSINTSIFYPMFLEFRISTLGDTTWLSGAGGKEIFEKYSRPPKSLLALYKVY